jgi:hypothetical protein
VYVAADVTVCAPVASWALDDCSVHVSLRDPDCPCDESDAVRLPVSWKL